MFRRHKVSCLPLQQLTLFLCSILCQHARCTHTHTPVACGCHFSDFVSILFKHKSFITHFLLWRSCISIRCKKYWTPQFTYSFVVTIGVFQSSFRTLDKMHLKMLTLFSPNVSQPFSFCHLCFTTLVRQSENHSFNLFGFCAKSF